jgi:hypothetical protein
MKPTHVADCGHVIPALPDGHVGGTGYATAADTGKTMCYQCAADDERLAMLKDGKATLYISRSADNRWVISNWTSNASISYAAFNITKSHGYGFGRQYDVVTGRFYGPDGKLWAFRNAGDNQIARCKRLKDAR